MYHPTAYVAFNVNMNFVITLELEPLNQGIYYSYIKQICGQSIIIECKLMIVVFTVTRLREK